MRARLRRIELTLLTCTLLLATCLGSAAAQQPEVDWITDYNQARITGKERSQVVVLFVSSQNCHYCRIMEREAFATQQFQQMSKNSIVAARIDIDPDSKLAEQLAITIFPTTIMIDTDGTILDYVRGYVQKDQLVSRIASATLSSARVAQR